MDLLQAFILGTLQGVTEWLPISSSAHLALAQQLMGLQVPVSFDVMLHMGTLLAVIAYYWKKLLALDVNTLALIVAGSIPTAIIGFAFKGFFESMFSSPPLIGVALVLTGCVLYATKWLKGKRRVGFLDSLLMGVAQGIAVAPGISRSGWTISAGMMRGVEKEKAADFSFMLAIPALIGAALFEGRNIAFSGIEWEPIVLGVIVAALVGYASIAVLLKLIKRGDFYLFAFYCWLVGIAAILVQYFI